MTDNFKVLLQGGDLRSIGQSDEIIDLVKTQNDFDKLFSFLFDNDRLVIMRAADAAEKLTRQHPEYLQSHTEELFVLCNTKIHKELKWHLALMLARVELDEKGRVSAINILRSWLFNDKESVIVRVNSLQALFELGDNLPTLISRLGTDMPSAIQARVRILYSPKS